MHMEELWDIYDANRNSTGRTHRRGDPMQPGDYHLVVHVWIRSGEKYFITRRAPEKEVAPLIWEVTGGSALAGEDSLAAALREVKEETGITLRPENGVVFESITNENLRFHANVWLFRQEITLDDFVPQPGETIDAKLAYPDELRAMVGEGVTFFKHEHLEPLFLFAELLEREEMFAWPPPGTSRAQIEELLARDFGEIGASGGICTRARGIDILAQRSLAPPERPWKITGYKLRALSNTVCLATYTLLWEGRKIGSSTVWRLENGAWRAAYHQGTKIHQNIELKY